MLYTSLDALVSHISSEHAARGGMDTFLSVGSHNLTTFAVWSTEPDKLQAPINIKWLHNGNLFVRTSRSPRDGFNNTWIPVTTLAKALEPQQWDQVKPNNWEFIQHVTSIGDPHGTARANRAIYSSEEPSTEHVITHGLGTFCSVAVYVGGKLVLTEVENNGVDTVTVRFPFPETCEVVIT